VKATRQDGTYPRPMLCRPDWLSLDGPWGFVHDDEDIGRRQRWFEPAAADRFTATIEVPNPPESPASGVGVTEFHPVVWYRRTLSTSAFAPSGLGDRRLLIHFGAVDYRATVWFDGELVVTHVGGQTPFTADVTDAMIPGAAHHVVVVRAEDDPGDLAQPRGKQDWREKPHGIWYERTTGIWQSVWTETVAPLHVTDLAWTTDPAGGVIRGELTLSSRPKTAVRVEVTVSFEDELLSQQSFVVRDTSAVIDVGVAALRNGQERARLLWSPEHPALLDIEVVLRDTGSGREFDTVASYVGLRSVSVGGGSFDLNGQPYYVRAVLDQGYRPQTHLAARDTAQLRSEVELMKAMGFNCARVHQKAEDPRFLFWADRLGLLVWGESAAAYEFSPTAVELFVAEWTELVRRDRSHPSIVVWVPINESWGVQDIASSRAQQQFSQALASLTRALDPTRPVVSNEGWEHVDSDILGLHDYTTDAELLRSRYADRDSVAGVVRAAHGPQGRRPVLTDRQLQRFVNGDAPLMITEFGGVSMTDAGDAWGYTTVGSDSEYATLLRDLFDAVRASAEVAGFCYTQFMDTGQETNGLLFSDARPKLPLAAIRELVTGVKDVGDTGPGSTFGWVD
jgi:beta-galactosidase/beta-glucuronidase